MLVCAVIIRNLRVLASFERRTAPYGPPRRRKRQATEPPA
jgi:hypothetical protein